MPAQAVRTPGDIEVEFIQLYLKIKERTMVDWERAYSLYSAVRYVLAAQVPGDLVECGVWKGGCCMLMAMTLLKHGGADRTIHLFDTFAGMAQPTDRDVTMDGKRVASAIGRRNSPAITATGATRRWTRSKSTWPQPATRWSACAASRARWRTPPGAAPAQIALLRLDTDWYASTYHELTHLFPRLSPGGVLICDDYSYWQGQKKAVDQYIREHSITMLLNRITTSAVGIKMR